jgi:hypothetical protein
MRLALRPLFAALCVSCALACSPESGDDPACGDGRVDPGEACDDGNRRPGDGCDAACAAEPPAQDCAGVAGGAAELDRCGRCVGGTTGETACVQDCAGVWGGTASLDHCDTCTGGTTGALACVQDCAGAWGGVATADHCGICVGGTTGRVACAQDCAGTWGGVATADHCGICVGGTTGRVACAQDCAGTWGGAASLDHCGTCVGGTTGKTACTQDCAGVWGGTASVDACGSCVGGTTGKTACTQDCAGVYGGTASVDACGACVGGTTGKIACTQDCAGVWGGTASVDRCGVCVGGTTGKTACTQDCAGVWGGVATTDTCNRCTGGTTGRVACAGGTCPLGARETIQALVDNPACEVVAVPDGAHHGPVRVDAARMGGKRAVEVRGASRDGTVFETGGAQVFWIEPDTTLTLTRLTFRGHAEDARYTGNAGAAVYNRGTTTLDGVLATRNIGLLLGPIANEGRMEIRASVITENDNRGGSYAMGGAIYNAGELHVLGSTITGNRTSSTGLNYGGALCNDGGLVTIEDSDVGHNHALNPIRVGGTMEGGGLFTALGAVDVRRSRIHHNRIETAGNGAHGGGIAAWGSIVTLSPDSEVSFNEAIAEYTSYGAGIYLQDGAELHADGVPIEGNVGKADLWVGGAAITARRSSVRLAGNRVANNHLEVTAAYGGQLLGGVVYVREGTVSITGGQLVGNTMVNGWVQGGLVRVDEYASPSEVDEALALDGVEIADNVVTTNDRVDGGLVSAVRSLRVNGCDVHSNAVTASDAQGGVVHFVESRGATPPGGALTLEGTRVVGNTVTATDGVSGGILYASLVRTSPIVATIRASTFVGNSVSTAEWLRGGAFFLEEPRHVAFLDAVVSDNVITAGVEGGSTTNPGIVHGGVLYQTFTSGFASDPDPDAQIELIRTDLSRNRIGSALATERIEGGVVALYVPWHAEGRLFTLVATNATLAENVVEARTPVAGALLNVFNKSGSEVLVVLRNATVARNRAGGPLGAISDLREPLPSPYYRSAVVQLQNTILAGNDAPGTADCPLQGPLSTTMSFGHNLLGDVTACAGMTTTTTDLVAVPPRLGTYADHGGPVPTVSLEPESPAVDGGDPAGCLDDAGTPLATDQRGFPRPAGPRCDIGAFELERP